MPTILLGISWQPESCLIFFLELRRIRRNFSNVFLKDSSPVSPALGFQRHFLLMPVWTPGSSLVCLVLLVLAQDGECSIVGGFPLLHQDGASKVGSALDRSGAAVQTSSVSLHGPHSSA